MKIKIHWKLAFFIMTGMFLALLFYTVVLTLQTQQYMLMTLKRMKMEMEMKKAVPTTPAVPSTKASPSAELNIDPATGKSLKLK